MEHQDEDPFTNSMIPTSRPPWRSFALSMAVQVAMTVAIVVVTWTVADKVEVHSPYFQLTFLKHPVSVPKAKLPKAAFHTPEVSTVAAVELPTQSEPKSAPKILQPSLHAPAAKVVPLEAVVAPVLLTEPTSAASLQVNSQAPPKKPREGVQLGGLQDASTTAPLGIAKAAGAGQGNPALEGGERVSPRQSRGSILEGAFAGPTPVALKVRGALSDGAAIRTKPVQIKFKPRPSYSIEARTMKVEGDVVLAVVFTSAGTVTVKGLIKGLGHGLDESAEDAARQIQFVPAQRDGQSVDTEGSVRITFQLAS
jgi:TonB family protein